MVLNRYKCITLHSVLGTFFIMPVDVKRPTSKKHANLLQKRHKRAEVHVEVGPVYTYV